MMPHIIHVKESSVSFASSKATMMGWIRTVCVLSVKGAASVQGVLEMT